MGIEKFTIDLDSPHAKYSSGFRIKGKVKFQISGHETASEITIRLHGLACTKWFGAKEEPPDTSGGGYFSARHRVLYHNVQAEKRTGAYGDSFKRLSGTAADLILNEEDDGNTFLATETLIDEKIRLFGNGNTRRIPNGKHALPFVLTVPNTSLPVSCVFDDAFVSYCLEAQIKRSENNATDPKARAAIGIFTIVDLRNIDSSDQPIETSETKPIPGCCFTGGKYVTIKTTTPQLGYSAGDVIVLSVHIDNGSSVNVKNLSASLNQKWTFTAVNKAGEVAQRVKLESLGSNTHGEVPGKSKLKWELTWQLPSELFHSMSQDAHGIVKMEYIINVEAIVESCAGKAEFDIQHPIIIGTRRALLGITPSPTRINRSPTPSVLSVPTTTPTLRPNERRVSVGRPLPPSKPKPVNPAPSKTTARTGTTASTTTARSNRARSPAPAQRPRASTQTRRRVSR